jgi:hypothetical protein
MTLHMSNDDKAVQLIDSPSGTPIAATSHMSVAREYLNPVLFGIFPSIMRQEADQDDSRNDSKPPDHSN